MGRRRHHISEKTIVRAFALCALAVCTAATFFAWPYIGKKAPIAEPHPTEEAHKDYVQSSEDIEKLMASLREEIKLPDGNDANKLVRQARDCAARAMGGAFWETTVKVCKALDFEPKTALTLSFFESRLGIHTYNEVSGAKSPWQILDDPFLEMFARHGAKLLPIVKKLDAAAYKQMRPFVGLVKMVPIGKTNASDFKYDISACQNLLGDKTNLAKLNKADRLAAEKKIAEKINERILALRDSSRNVALPEVVSTCFAIMDLKEKAPDNSDLGCILRLIHNYGGRGGQIIANASTSKLTMYEIMNRIYKNTYPDPVKRNKHVCKILVNNGIKTKKGKADMNRTVKSFARQMELDWVLVASFFERWVERSEIATRLNEHLKKTGAPLRVMCDPLASEIFSLKAKGPVRTARANGSSQPQKPAATNG